MPLFNKLKKDLEVYLTDEQIESVHQAYLVADSAHEGQKRFSGEKYITHPVEVARILAHMQMDHQSIMAALLHDVLEDTGVEKDTMIEQFGEQVADLVDGVSKLTQIKFESRAEAQAEYFRKMVLAMVRDIRVILVKLADRLHNMRTLGVLPAEKRCRIARETLEIYAPIAHRVGMHTFYIELEDLGFAALYPMRFRVLQESVAKARGNRKEIISVIENTLKECLQQKKFTAVEITGREKHLYGIYKKMREKAIPFSEIMDVYGFRIVVDSVDTCYRVLGAVHNRYKPVTQRFKDYIALPKANGYQSLHTTLFGPYGVPIEIQVRTEEMHRMAENGIASHWLYKAQEGEEEKIQQSAREWLKGLLEMQQSAGNSLEFIENVKIDLFPNDVYVFTPKGNILELPNGVTVVDFAYAIHSDIGNSCVAAKVDRRLVPLSTLLANGQSVEIITAPGARPNPAWLSFVVTGKARSNIRHFLKSQQRSESINLGKRMLDNALRAMQSSSEQISEEKMRKVLAESQLAIADDLYEAIGLGNQMASLVARRLALTEIERAEADSTVCLDPTCPLSIKGTEGMIVSYAKCCRPIPGDPIVAFLSAGKGIVVHTDQCKNMVSYRDRPDKCIPVCWEEHVEGEFQVEIRVELANQRGVLATLARTIAFAESNIDNISVSERDEKYSLVNLTLSVANRIHLARVMRRLKALRVVSRIYRVK